MILLMKICLIVTDGVSLKIFSLEKPCSFLSCFLILANVLLDLGHQHTPYK